MPRSRTRLWLTALLFVALAVIIFFFYQHLRAGHIQAAEGRLEYNAGRFDLAEKAYARATQADPDNAEAWYWLGISRKNQGLSTTAADALAEATALNPDRIDWWIEYAEALQWAERFSEAEQAWQKVMALLPPDDPRLYQARENLALSMGGQGGTNVDRAVDMLEEILAKNEDRRVRFALAQVLAWAGRLEESKEQYSRALNSQREE